MKKAISLLLLLVLCLSLVACGGQSQNIESNDNIDNNTTNNNNTDKTEDEAIVLFDEESKYPFVNQARFHELVEEVELTTENWLDYLEVCSYTVEKVETDTFGDIVSSTTSTAYVLGAKNNRYYHLRKFAIELKDKSIEELKIYESTSTGGEVFVNEDFSIDQYECTRIKGTLYLIDVPEETIREAKGVGRYFTVRYSDISYGPPIDCFIRGTDGYEIGQMLDFVLY